MTARLLPCFAVIAVTLALAAACVGRATSPAGRTGETSPSAVASPAEASATPAASPSPTGTTATASPGATATTGPAGSAEHDAARTHAHIAYLTMSIGPRVAGTSGETSAADYIRAEFEASGYAVEVLPFQFEGDRFRPAAVILGSTRIEALSLAGSKGGTVSGPAVYVGLADAAGIGGRRLDGAIAVADRGTLAFGDKYENVRAAGAVGLVVVNNQDGTFSGTLRREAVFPTVAVSGADSGVLKAAAVSRATLRIEAPPSQPTTSVNVVARAEPGASCDVLVGGHHDTVHAVPGANDNASGAATVIELARAFAADGLDRGLCFATFGAEESGLYGSRALAERLKGDGTLPRLMVNLDVTGIGAGVAVIGSPDPVNRAVQLAGQLGIPAIAAELPPNTGSDHQSFRDLGVPVVFFTSGEFPTIHSPRDVIGDIDAAELDRVGDLAYATIKDQLGQVAPR